MGAAGLCLSLAEVAFEQDDVVLLMGSHDPFHFFLESTSLHLFLQVRIYKASEKRGFPSLVKGKHQTHK